MSAADDARDDVFRVAGLLAELDRVLNPLPLGEQGDFDVEPPLPPSLPPSGGGGREASGRGAGASAAVAPTPRAAAAAGAVRARAARAATSETASARAAKRIDGTVVTPGGPDADAGAGAAPAPEAGAARRAAGLPERPLRAARMDLGVGAETSRRSNAAAGAPDAASADDRVRPARAGAVVAPERRRRRPEPPALRSARRSLAAPADVPSVDERAARPAAFARVAAPRGRRLASPVARSPERRVRPAPPRSEGASARRLPGVEPSAPPRRTRRRPPPPGTSVPRASRLRHQAPPGDVAAPPRRARHSPSERDGRWRVRDAPPVHEAPPLPRAPRRPGRSSPAGAAGAPPGLLTPSPPFAPPPFAPPPSELDPWIEDDVAPAPAIVWTRGRRLAVDARALREAEDRLRRRFLDRFRWRRL